MRNLFNFLVLSAFAVLLSGCSKDLVSQDAPSEGEAVSLRLTGEIDYMLPETRVNSSGFAADDAIGVYATTTSLDNSGNKADNKKFSYNSSSSQFEATSGNEINWSNETEEIDIYAYYPYNSSVSSAGAIPVEVKADQSTEANFYLSDVLRANKNNVKKTTEAVGLNFTHMLSKLSITLQPSSNFTAEEFNSATKVVTIEGLVPTGELNLKNNEVIKEGSTTQTITALPGANNTFSAIVVPQDAVNVKIRLKLGDKYYATTLSSIKYEKGKDHKYTLTVKKSASGMVLKSSSISNWTSSSITEKDMKEETTSN